MAVRLVERHGLEFRPRPAIARPRSLDSARDRQSPADRRAPAAIIGVCALALLTLAAVYAFGRRPAAPLTDFAPVRLALAGMIGFVVSAVHRHVKASRTAASLERAQILLCVAGALTMVLIDNSVARAFGIAGAASIVRFRTPVEDPTDATVLFLLMGLGMASGVGAFAVSLAGAAGVCLLLAAFALFAPEHHRRNVSFELVGNGSDFPVAHVQCVFARYGVPVEPAEWSRDTSTRVKYRALVDEALSLEEVGAELMERSEGALASVTWDVKKSS